MVKRGSAGHRRAACVQSSRFTIGVYGNLERLYLETGTSEEKNAHNLLDLEWREEST